MKYEKKRIKYKKSNFKGDNLNLELSYNFE